MFPPCRDITLDDVKDLQNMKGTPLDILAAVACRAKEIFDDHVAATKGKAKITYEVGESSSTPAKPKKRKRNSSPPPPPPPPPPLPEEFLRRMREMAGGKELEEPPKLVIQKSLFKTDLSRIQNRLSIPINQITDDFLTEEEKRLVSKEKKAMEVRMIEPSLDEVAAKFAQWEMRKNNGGKTTYSYNIIGKWSDIFERNELKVNMEVQLWSFRVDQKLCLALVRLPH